MPETESSNDQLLVRTDPSKAASLWVVIVVALGLFVFALLYPTDSSDAAYLAGYHFPRALIAFGVLYLILLRNQDKAVVAVSFALLYSASFMGGMIGATTQKDDLLKSIIALEDRVERASRAASRAERIELDDSPGLLAQGKQAQLVIFLHEHFDALASLHNDYLAELTEIGWDNILYPPRLYKDKKLIESRNIMEKAKVIAAKYQKLTADFVDSTPARIEKLDVSPDAKREMMAGFNRSVEKSRPLLKRQWELEITAALEVEKMLDLLDMRERQWTIQDGMIVFYANDDLVRYNSHLSQIDSILNEQEGIQRKSLEFTRQKLEELKKTLRQ